MNILGQILAQVDNAKRVATANVKDFITNPADFLNMVQGRIAEHTDKVVSGDIKLATQTALDAMPSAGGGLAGVIRKGGRTDLNMTHESAISKLLTLLRGRASMTSPSVAISKNNAFPFGEISSPRRASLILNPASHRFDPNINPANLLVNRDAYVTRQRWTPPEVRLGITDDLRLTEGAGGIRLEDIYKDINMGALPGLQQQLSILASPRFKSFEQYEKLKTGANTLESADYDPSYVRQLLNQFYPEDIQRIKDADNLIDSSEFLRRIQKDADAAQKMSFDDFAKPENVSKQNALILQEALTKTSSDYAELKVAGEVPISDRTVSAVMLSPYSDVASITPKDAKLLEELRARASFAGLRTGTPRELMPPDMAMTYADLADQSARILSKAVKKGVDPWDAAKELPNSAAKYFPPGYLPTNVEDALRKGGATDLYEETLKAIEYSPHYAADVASILTARDLDASSTENILKVLREKGNK